MMGDATVADDLASTYLDIVRYDWLVARAWNRLHFAELSPEDAVDVIEEGGVDGPVRLACGRTARYVCIPGFITRMGAQRCRGCCRALGLPAGKGSPKNDQACRLLLGLP